MAQRKVNSGSFKNAFNTAKNQGKGLFTWNGKQYNTMKKGENSDTFRQQHSDYDQFLGNIASSQGGWHVQNPINTSYIINKVPKPITEKSNGVSPSNQVQQNTQLQMFTNDDIRSLGFRNYNGLVSAVRNQANTNNNFVKAMVNRYGSDTSKWNQNTIENDLGVNGTYRSFGRGDFGDMSRSMASWLGTHNGNLAKQEQERIWNQNAGVKYSLNDNSVLANKYQLSKPSISNNLVNLKFKQGDKATDQGFQGAIDNLQEQANALKDYNAGSHLGWNPGANKTTAIKHNNNGNMQGVVNDVIPKQRANNQRKRYFDQWTAYVKKWHPNMLGRFKNTMQNMGYKYNWNTGVYSKSGSSYRLNNGQLQTQNIYTGNWSNINNSDALPGMPANGLSKRLQK